MRNGRTIFVAMTVLAMSLFLGGVVCAEGGKTGGKSTSSTKGSVRKNSKKRAKKERGQKAPTPERISEIQLALAKDGSYEGPPNGKWDAATIEAMRKFQMTQGLNPNGKLDAKTLQRLGLGSQTAGLAAPIPGASNSAKANQASPEK